MNFDEAPRLNKLPFILGDIALLLVAGLIANQHPHPLDPLPLILITLCVVVGAVLLSVPFLLNYAREQDEAAAALRHELTEQFKKLMAASEHLQGASAQLKTVEESAARTLQAAEKLPARLQERLADFTAQLAASQNEENVALKQELAALRASQGERLAGIAEKIAKSTAEWGRLESDLRKQLAAAAELEPKLGAVVAALDAKIAALGAATPNAPPVTTIPPPLSPPVIEAAAPVEPASVTAAPPAEGASAESPKPARKPRAPRKPRSGGEAAATALELVAESVADESLVPEDFSQVPPEERKPESVSSADGRTRLTVVSYVGIGNKLYLRGQGPGLSWDKGVPLQFVSIGRWRWETAEATAPVACKVYLNDKTEAPGDAINLAPGTEQEINASF